AREVSIPAQNAFLHSIIQHYHVDGQDGVLSPLGMLGQRLEADFHIIHGVRTRIQNTIRCVKELPLDVEDVVFGGLASAQVVLTQHQKDLGALVIDMGGGTTDYVLYADGAVKQSGCLALGGDHITNDISMGLRIPMARAEKLKIEEGSCILGNCLPGEMILLKDDSGFAGKEIERETLNTIIHLRLRETLELLKRRLDDEPFINYLGAGIFITGGCSLLNGIDNLAEEIFEMPAHVAPAGRAANARSWTAPAVRLYHMIQLSKNYSLPERAEEFIPIKIVSVGGAGLNALDRIVLDGLEGAEVLAVNTDVQSLASSVA